MSKSAFEILAAGGAYDGILKERQAIDRIWGNEQHSLEYWTLLLVGEAGIVSDRVRSAISLTPAEMNKKDPYPDVRRAVIRVAAMAVTIVERIDAVRDAEKYKAIMKKGNG